MAGEKDMKPSSALDRFQVSHSAVDRRRRQATNVDNETTNERERYRSCSLSLRVAEAMQMRVRSYHAIAAGRVCPSASCCVARPSFETSVDQDAKKEEKQKQFFFLFKTISPLPGQEKRTSNRVAVKASHGTVRSGSGAGAKRKSRFRRPEELERRPNKKTSSSKCVERFEKWER